jgi:hypothetical protein
LSVETALVGRASPLNTPLEEVEELVLFAETDEGVLEGVDE